MRTKTFGVLFVLIGVASLSIVNLVELLTSQRVARIGWAQLVASVPGIVAIGLGAWLIWRDQRLPSPRSRKFILAVGLATCLCAAILSLIAFGLVHVDKGRYFRYDKTTGPEKAYTNVVKVAGLAKTRICRCAPNKISRITLPGGFETQLSIYDKGGPNPRPGVVMAHGNVWMGGDLSTYRLLASRLAQSGFIVLTIDFPGFGMSDDPFGRGPAHVAEASDWPAIMDVAVEYLIANTEVDRSTVVAFGHSGSVEAAMRVGITNPNVSKVAVMVAPPPARFADTLDGTAEYTAERGEYFTSRHEVQYQFVYGRSVPEWNSSEQNRQAEKYADDVWSSYQRAGHKPFLLILGERDEPTGHESVRAALAAVSAPKDLLEVQRSDHYMNTAQSLGFIFYDVDVANQLTQGLVDWINQDQH